MRDSCVIIVCTHNRSSSLKRLIDSFYRGHERVPCELLVVDNNSTDNTERVCSEAGVRRIFEPSLGLSTARNSGLANSDSDIVVYLDDDVVVKPGWFANLLRPFHENDVAVVGGELDPVWEVPRPRWLTDRWLHSYSVSLGWSVGPREISGREWLCEGNIAFRRAPLEAVGRFPTNLGRIGSILLSGEGVVVDSIRKAGGRAIFVPQAIVEHNIPKSRLQPKWLMRRMFWQGVTQSEVDKYLVERLGSIAPLQEWRDVRLPVSHKRWEQMFNSYPDSDFNTIIQECYDLGYALQKVGLLGV